jgi:GNAT superfamily N-acetyltransferase
MEIRLLENADLPPAALQGFNRYQVTTRVRYLDNDRYSYKDDYFIENWDEQKKIEVIRILQRCIDEGGIVVGAYVDGKLIGFANIENTFFGKKREYIELPFIHVSNEYRGRGIGKKLFTFCCEKAKAKGAKKLYIGAHPSEESQNFYKAMGCILAEEVNQKICEKEPLDLQLEFIL